MTDIDATEADFDALVRTLYGEARGSTPGDRCAVAHVILNRATAAKAHQALRGRAHPLFGNGTIASACKAPWQFSCWNEGDPNREKLRQAGPSDRAFLRCLVDAAAVLAGDVRAPFPSNTTHYHTKAMGWPKAWGPVQVPVHDSGPHLFYNTVK